MVRLKAYEFKPKSLLSDMFQFHYGSIKRLMIYLLIEAGLLFQFHYGSIKSDFSFEIFIKFFPFQFHYGSIKRFLGEKIYQT